jgi:general transcription factor 3C polypeptide 3 (transcription factor C subunit 4)
MVSFTKCPHSDMFQGFAFFSRYRTLRGGDEHEVDEVDYNFGRAFQQLGLHSYAVTHYEKVLQSAEARLTSGIQVKILFVTRC